MCLLTCRRYPFDNGRGPTRRRSRRGPASVRRPSRLERRQRDGVTPPASRDSHAGRRRAAFGFGTWALAAQLSACSVSRTSSFAGASFRRPTATSRNFGIFLAVGVPGLATNGVAVDLALSRATQSEHTSRTY